MKVKIKDLSKEQRNKVCESIPFKDCCTLSCPLCEVEGRGQCACHDECTSPASPEFEEKEIEVDL